MHGRKRHGGAHRRIDAFDEGAIDPLEAVQVRKRPSSALIPRRGAARVLHALDEGVHLRALDAGKVVADRHVEDESVISAQLELAGEELAGEPALDVLAKRILAGELCGPLAVIAHIARGDAGFGDAGGHLGAIHNLDGLELEEAPARHVAGDEVLRELRVGTRRRTERHLDALVVERDTATRLEALDALDAENAPLLLIFRQRPIHELRKRHRFHDVAHRFPSLVPYAASRPHRGFDMPAALCAASRPFRSSRPRVFWPARVSTR